MRYDDLLGTPYKPHGRGNGGYDCYGLVLECCRRAGTPLKDPFIELVKLRAGGETDYIAGLNVREIPKPKAGAVVECRTGENLHVGYMVTSSLVLHITASYGAKITHVQALNPIKYYEVVNES